MCIYHYCYFSACRHGQLTRISYCDEIPALNPPVFDRQWYEADASSTSRDQYAISSLHQSTPKINKSSSQRMTTQQQNNLQYNSIMSMVTSLDAGHTPASRAVIQNQNSGINNRPTSTSEAAPVDEEHARRESMLRQARSLLDSQGLSDISIDIALDTQSLLQIETAHDVSLNDPLGTSGHSVDSNFSCDTGSSWEHVCKRVEREPGENPVEQSPHSPRKPIPIQWLPRAISPKLATAKRAKERVQKKISEKGSPECSKTVRATHSSVDLSRLHGRAGATYLTKEALSAVEPTRTPPISPKGLAKISTPSKPAWNSPVSPLRDVTRQQSWASLRQSPTKSSHSATESAKAVCLRGLSNVTATSDKGSIYNTEASPVRSPTSSEDSFWTAVEDLEGSAMNFCDSNADNDHDQGSRNANTVSAPRPKTNNESQATLSKGKVALHISIPNASKRHDPKAPVSINTMSNIPRIGTTSKDTTSPHIRALQRPKSMGTIISEAKTPYNIWAQPNQRHPSTMIVSDISSSLEDENTSSTSTRFHDFDIDLETMEGGKTSNAVSQSQQVKHAHFDVRSGLDGLAHVETGRCNEKNCSTKSKSTEAYELSISLSRALQESKSSLRTPSNSSEQGPRDVIDPVLIDSAIIYSRKRTDGQDTGSTHLATAPDSTASATLEHGVIGENTDPIQATSEGHPQGLQGQTNQVKPANPNTGSDLRATATEFVPKLTPASGSVEFASEPVTFASFQDLPGLPDMTTLDKHGIPFLWYMYGIQFAYEQGVRNGRPKLPRKFKPRKPRRSGSWAADSLHVRCQDDFSIPTIPKTSHPIPLRQRQSHAGPMSLHDGDAQSQHPIGDQESISPSSHETMLPSDANSTEPNRAFESQFSEVAGYTTMSRDKSNSLPRHYNVDFAKIQNTGFPMEPRIYQPSFHHSVPRQAYRNNRRSGNGLYGGRGNSIGIPIGATAPFPDPVPPQGRPDQSQPHAGMMTDNSGFVIGTEACGMVDITCATELIGGGVCNACDPTH